MLKKILAVLAMLYAACAFAAVDVNKASAADLDGIKGIGPTTSKSILDERKKGEFKDWNDLISRVKGVGQGNAAKFSAAGLTVNGAAFSKTAAKAEKKEEKKDAKAEKKEDKTAASNAKPAASASGAAAASAAKPAASAKK
jgi:competence protein ComEA